LDGPFRETLFQRTHGHPFFTVELLREMQERRDLVRDDAGMWVAGPTVDWETLPARVEAAIARHIGRLPEPLQEALKVASVEGESFIAEAIAKVQGIDGQRFVRQLSTVADRTHKLVHSEGPERQGYQVLSHYRFSHSLYQSYLYRCLDATELLYLHEALGHALEEIYVGRTEEIAVQLAYHFGAAELLEGAIAYLQLAAPGHAFLGPRRGHCSPLPSFDAAGTLTQEFRTRPLRIEAPTCIGHVIQCDKRVVGPGGRTGLSSGAYTL